MKSTLVSFIRFWLQMIRCAVIGGRTYYVWMAALAVLCLLGAFSWVHHLHDGLVVTNMTDEVSWGIGIANFVYFVGVADAAVVLIVPAYFFQKKDAEEVIQPGLLLAVVAVIMCLLFITTDLGRPERMWHLMPPIGFLNLPSSLLAWDVVAFSGYLGLSMYIPCYLLFMKYLGRRPNPWAFMPVICLSVFWAVAMHTITAFLLNGLGSRPFWNTAILPPRFLISAFASGPCVLMLILRVVERTTKLKPKQTVVRYLTTVVSITMSVNLFLLICEVFKEFYTASHSASAQYLFFGLEGHNMLPKFIWVAILLNIVATVIFIVPKLHQDKRLLYGACVLAIIGIWIEKGMGLIFPGFIPTPLGEIVEYAPNFAEILLCIGILALGAMMYTAMTKVAIAIQTGELKEKSELRKVQT